MINKEISAKIANYLLETEAVKLNTVTPFVWTSGIKSPIYCDNRVTLSYPEIRTYIRDVFSELIVEKFPETEYIAGIATAGIAQGALIADKLNLPYIYIRPEPKKHGLQNTVEGYLKPESKVILIEDLVSTGKSSLAALENLRQAGGVGLALLSIFTYGFEEALLKFQEAGCPYFSLSDFAMLIKVAEEKKYISSDIRPDLERWMTSPKDWR
jgi:orotate phosphoribosyltransferase